MKYTGYDSGASRLDDFSPGQLWPLLDEGQQLRILDEFFHDQSAELAELLDDDLARRRAGKTEDASRLLGDSFRRLWHDFRDRHVNRLAADGQIHDPIEEGF